MFSLNQVLGKEVVCKKMQFSEIEGAFMPTPSKKNKYAFTLSEGATHVDNSVDIRKSAFTLSEVLITLGIIGVVSAMTLPTLVKNHQRQVFVTQLKKAVSVLSQGAEKAITDNNAISLAETKYNEARGATGVKNFFLDNFRVTQDCAKKLTPCFASSYTTINGKNFNLGTPVAVLTLADGISVFVISNAMADYNDWHGYYQFYIDVNGSQAPNIVGRDLFYMELYSDGKVAETYDPTSKTYDDYNLETCQDGKSYGNGCLTKIMHDGWKMDY